MLSGQLREATKQRIGLAASAIIASIATIAIAATDPWEQVLSQQLAAEQMCDMSGTCNVHEFPLGHDVVMMGSQICIRTSPTDTNGPPRFPWRAFFLTVRS